ncbi:MAG: TIR domain-containing protein [Rhodobacter sp.]|nr:TIR domain-containing protein [Rhodobacter sp.]
MTYQIAVFVSHSWSYGDHYSKINEWIFNENWQSDGEKIEFYNTSVPRSDPIHGARNASELQRRIYERIQACHIVVCPMGMYSTHSFWIERELDGALLYRRPILAVNPWAQERKSSVVRNRANHEVGWNKKSVVDGIWKLTRGNRT